MPQIENLEDALEKLGGFGKFQLFALVSIIYPELPGGILALLPVYAGRTPEYWDCILDNPDGTPLVYQIKHADVCNCNGTLQGGTFSMVTEWNLVCEYSWVADFITSLFMAGMFVGGFVGSSVSDWIGRKKALYISCLLTFLGGAAAGVAPSPLVYAASRFLVGYAIAAFLVVGAIYPMEFFTTKWRSLSGTLGPWGEGVMILPLFAYFIQDWRTLSWVSSLPMLLMILPFPFLPESPRWLLKNNKVKEAQKAFDQIASWNGRPKLEEWTVAKLGMILSSQDKSELEISRKEPRQSSPGGGYWQLVSNKSSCLKALNFMGIWFSNSLIYYTISFNTKNLSGNINLNMVFQGLIDAFGYRTAPFGIGLLGRKKAIVFYLIAASIPLVGIVLMELDLIRKEELAITIMSLVGKFFIAGGWSAIKCFTGESFPTTLRQSAIGICTVAAAVGGVLAPQNIFLGTFNPAIPYFILGGFSVFSAFISFFLTETSGRPIVETN